MNAEKIGVWIIGAYGSVATTVILGALALKNGLVENHGLLTEQEPFSFIDFASWDSLVFGGCDIRQGSLVKSAEKIIRETSNIDPHILRIVADELSSIELYIGKGISINCGQAIEGLESHASRPITNTTLREQIALISSHLESFKSANNLSTIVVVNLASTEPELVFSNYHSDLDSFDQLLEKNDCKYIRASTLYAYAAVYSGFPYINFTPSSGALIPAIIELAEKKNVPVMGNDGKTGETLLKSALAPMFKYRNLEVLSWEGFNILGNLDGEILDNPENKGSKIKTKGELLPSILGYAPHSGVHINYVPSLSDQKTAWDFIHFQGFLGSKMSLQLIWQGFDSILAAPLVLDLVRWTRLAQSARQKGLMSHLACYFKSPLGINEHRFYEQYESLIQYACSMKVP